VKVAPAAAACVIDALLVGRLGDAGGWAAPCVTIGEMFRNDLNPTWT